MTTLDDNRLTISRRDVLTGSAATAGISLLGPVAASEQSGIRSRSETRTDESADLALVNGRILTFDRHNTIAPAMAIRDGRIVEIGRSVSRRTRTIDLHGATVIPGLIDAHAHIYWSLSNPGYEARDIELAASMQELLQAITERARSVQAGQFITCNGGWTRKGLADNRLPTLAELDAAAPHHPVWLAENQSEASWVDPVKHPPLPAVTNSPGLAFFRTHGVMGDATTGLISWQQSTAALQKAQTEEDRKRSVMNTIDFAVARGLTMIHDFGNSMAQDTSLESHYPYIVDLWREQKLKLRFRLRLSAPHDDDLSSLQARVLNNINRMGDDVLRLNGIGEGMGDGTGPKFVEAAKFLAARGWSAHVHSVSVGEPGDISQNLAHLAGYREANAVRSIKDLRWSLAHVNYITRDIVQGLMDLNVGVTGDAWQYPGDREPVPMGPPWRMLLESGIHIGAGSDCTGTAGFNPWLTIYYMTTGKINTGEVGNPGQSISRMDALKIHTAGSAWHSFDDDKLGTLEVGKLADVAVLSDDPLTVSDEKLRHLTSTLTLQAGRIVHSG